MTNEYIDSKPFLIFRQVLVTLILVCVIVGDAMGQNKAKAQQNLMTIQKAYSRSETGKDSLRAYKKFDKQFKKYSKRFGHDSDYVRFGFSRGQMALNAGDFQQAILDFTNIYSEFPNDAKAPLSLYYEAYIEEVYFKDKDEAENLYNLFLDKFPTHDLVHDVQLSLQYLR